MARHADTDTGEVTTPEGPATVGLTADEFQWETVHTEAPQQVTFDTVGDTLIAEYLGKEVINFEDKKGEAQSFTQLKFRVNDEIFVVNAGYDLLSAYADIPAHTITRTQLRSLVDVGQNDPMKSYRVDVAKQPAATVAE
jgi:hypothetical protein